MRSGIHDGGAGRRVARSSRQSLGSSYALRVADAKREIVRKIPQHTVSVENALWQKVKRIAAKRHERISDVIRRALVAYVEQYGHLDDGANG